MKTLLKNNYFLFAVILSGLILLIYSCENNNLNHSKEINPNLKTYKGLAVFELNEMSVRICGDSVKYWIDDSLQIVDSLFSKIKSEKSYIPFQKVYLEFNGYISNTQIDPRLAYNFDGIITITEIIKYNSKVPANCKESNFKEKDYYIKAKGNEPGWMITIYKSKDDKYYYELLSNYAQEKSFGIFNTYTSPINADSINLDKSPNNNKHKNSKNNDQPIIIEEFSGVDSHNKDINFKYSNIPCYDDSDYKYDGSATIKINKNEFSGCASKFKQK